jgi:hypothetical protein
VKQVGFKLRAKLCAGKVTEKAETSSTNVAGAAEAASAADDRSCSAAEWVLAA